MHPEQYNNVANFGNNIIFLKKIIRHTHIFIFLQLILLMPP